MFDKGVVELDEECERLIRKFFGLKRMLCRLKIRWWRSRRRF